MEHSNKQNITWKQINKIIKQQSESLDKDLFLVAVVNGGKIPTSMYSYYSGAIMGGTIDPKDKPYLINNIDDLVFCDEFLDTGATFRKLYEHNPGAKFVFTFCRASTWKTLTRQEKKKILVKPKLINNDNWLVFPWEE